MWLALDSPVCVLESERPDKVFKMYSVCVFFKWESLRLYQAVWKLFLYNLTQPQLSLVGGAQNARKLPNIQCFGGSSD